MADPQISQRLNDKFALSQLTETGATENSTLYTASNTWGTTVREVEVFNEPVADGAGEHIAQIAQSLSWLQDPAVFNVEDCGVTDAGTLYVLREPAQGQPLRSLIDGRVTWGSPFPAQEAANLVGPVAEAVDKYIANGRAGFLGRSINTDTLLVQPAGVFPPVKVALVGPTAAGNSVSDSVLRRQFADVVAELTGQPVDEALLEQTGSATEYLKTLINPTPAPQPQEWETTQMPQQHFPDTDPGMPAVQYDDYAQPDFAAPAKKKKPVWPWVAAGVLLLAGAGAGGYWYWQNTSIEPWGDTEAEIAQAFPDVVSDEEGGRGFDNLTCRTVEAEGDAQGKIRCASPDAGISITKFENAQARDAVIPASDKVERFGNDNCEFSSTQLEGQDLPAYFVAPEGDKANYLLLVNGKNADKMRAQLPLC